MDEYYVYIHFDPKTSVILYVGMGHGGRAYVVPTGRSHYSSRSSEHALYLRALLHEGYLPHEWINFKYRSISRQKAKLFEKQLIAELNPKFNLGQKRQLKFSKKQYQEMISLRNEGKSYAYIAKIMKEGIGTVWNSLNKTLGYKKL